MTFVSFYLMIKLLNVYFWSFEELDDRLVVNQQHTGNAVGLIKMCRMQGDVPEYFGSVKPAGGTHIS